MYYFIHPIDNSSEFLAQIYLKVAESIGTNNICVFSFKGDHEYRKEIEGLPRNSNIVFLGHGRADRLYGVLADSNAPYVSANEMHIFNDQNFLALACKSSELLKGTHKATNLKSAIGFGNLPTSDEEVRSIRNMRSQVIKDEDIVAFKEVIVKCISLSIIATFQRGYGYEYLYPYLRLLLNREIRAAVLDSKRSEVADLIFQMLNQMDYFCVSQSYNKE